MKFKSKPIRSLILGISIMLIFSLLLVACSSPPAEETPAAATEAPAVAEPARRESEPQRQLRGYDA